MKNIGNIIIGVRSGNKCIRGQYLNNINSGRKGFTKPWFFCSPKYDMDKFEDITDEFWDQYLNKGICLFSKHNEEVDSNQRYIYTDANTRKCKYCGLIQVRKKKKVTVYKDYWSIPKK